VGRAKGNPTTFVRALISGRLPELHTDGSVWIRWANTSVALEAEVVQGLISAGVLTGTVQECRAGAEARAWVRRQMSGARQEGYAAQHRNLVRNAEGLSVNLQESPLLRLSRAGAGESEPFLAPHHVEAGERVRRLADRAQMQPRVTMSYDAAHTASGKGGARPAEISDLAADARRELAELHRVLPPDCAGVVVDVCGFSKGLQTIESDRGWPRRSAKLVLRIALDQLARHYGLGLQATGPASRRNRTWLEAGARPDRFE
jgi:hypothetical protein